MKLITQSICILLLTCVPHSTTLGQAAQPKPITITTQTITGIGHEPDVCRRDPSDVIRVGDTYYVWYSKVKQGAPLYPSGYFATIWYATSKDEGRHWQEQGQAIAKGDKDAFDSYGIFTPNILFYNDKYYLYYTAVQDGFQNKGYLEIGKTRIAVAVATSPDGPWIKPKNNIVIEPNMNHNKFDSFRCDDSCLLVRNGQIWLYYKGRAWEKTPGQTKMGVAISNSPLGPFTKQNNGDPVQPEGHEVAVWAQDEGVVSLVTNVGRGIYFSKDGLHFAKASQSMNGKINAPGPYRPELIDHLYNKGVRWGVSMVHGRDPYILRWTAKFPTSKNLKP